MVGGAPVVVNGEVKLNWLYARLVKWLRRRPFTAEAGFRLPYRAPTSCSMGNHVDSMTYPEQLRREMKAWEFPSILDSERLFKYGEVLNVGKEESLLNS